MAARKCPVELRRFRSEDFRTEVEKTGLGGVFIYFFLNPFWERLSQFTNIFGRASNHHLVVAFESVKLVFLESDSRGLGRSFQTFQIPWLVFTCFS